MIQRSTVFGIMIGLVVWGWACIGVHAEHADRPGVDKPDLPPLDIYLLIGQSNMGGRAPYDEAEAGIIPRCYLLNDYDKWEPAQNPFNRYSSIEREDVPNKLGIGYTFVTTMLEHDPDAHIGIIVNARGGASMKYWEKGEWAYREAVRRTEIALEAGTLKGVLWHHGEANRGDNRYLRRLATFVGDLRAEFGMPDLPFVAGQIKDPGVVNRQIARLPNRVPYTAYAPIDGLTTFDRSHFDTRSIRIMGRRYAELMIELQEARAAHTSD